MPPHRLPDPGRLIAHRGASAVAPENTLSAFRAAADAGVRWVEFDVSLLGDGTAVLSHDATLDRCTDRSGPLTALGVADLAGIDAGSWFAPAFAGEPLPRLDTALAELARLRFWANLEMKPHDGDPAAIAHEVARALAGPMAGRVIVSSFEHESLAALRRLDATVPMALLYDGGPTADWRATAARIGASALHVHHPALTAELAAEVAEAGLDLRIYTLNDIDRGRAIRFPGLTGIVTDDPARWLAQPDWADWAGLSPVSMPAA